MISTTIFTNLSQQKHNHTTTKTPTTKKHHHKKHRQQKNTITKTPPLKHRQQKHHHKNTITKKQHHKKKHHHKKHHHKKHHHTTTKKNTTTLPQKNTHKKHHHKKTHLLLCTIQSTASVLLCTKTLYYKVPFQYHSVLQSTAPILTRTTSTTFFFLCCLSLLRSDRPSVQRSIEACLCTRKDSIHNRSVCRLQEQRLTSRATEDTCTRSTKKVFFGPVQLCAAKYPSSVTLYYKVLQSTAPVVSDEHKVTTDCEDHVQFAFHHQFWASKKHKVRKGCKDHLQDFAFNDSLEIRQARSETLLHYPLLSALLFGVWWSTILIMCKSHHGLRWRRVFGQLFSDHVAVVLKLVVSDYLIMLL